MSEQELERIIEWAKIGIQDTCPPTHSPVAAYELLDRLRDLFSASKDLADEWEKRADNVSHPTTLGGQGQRAAYRRAAEQLRSLIGEGS